MDLPEPLFVPTWVRYDTKSNLQLPIFYPQTLPIFGLPETSIVILYILWHVTRDCNFYQQKCAAICIQSNYVASSSQRTRRELWNRPEADYVQCGLRRIRRSTCKPAFQRRQTLSSIIRVVDKMRGAKLWPSPIFPCRAHTPPCLGITASECWCVSKQYLHICLRRIHTASPSNSNSTLCSLCHEVMDTQGHHALAACTTSLPSFIDNTAFCRLCTARFSVLHSSNLVVRSGFMSLGASTALQTCSPAWTTCLTWKCYIFTREACEKRTRNGISMHVLSLVAVRIAGFECCCG
jgi:hypothetical protein